LTSEDTLTVLVEASLKITPILMAESMISVFTIELCPAQRLLRYIPIRPCRHPSDRVAYAEQPKLIGDFTGSGFVDGLAKDKGYKETIELLSKYGAKE
jgi:hypothetical protein